MSCRPKTRRKADREAFALLLDAIADEFSPGNIPEVPDPELADVIVRLR